MDIDSHCSLVQALKKVSVHLDEHELNELSFEQVADFQKLKANLTTNIDRWDVVCQGAGFWQKRLQTTLLKVIYSLVFVHMVTRITNIQMLFFFIEPRFSPYR